MNHQLGTNWKIIKRIISPSIIKGNPVCVDSVLSSIRPGVSIKFNNNTQFHKLSLEDVTSYFCFFNACKDEVGGAGLLFANVLVLLSESSSSSSSLSPWPSLIEGVDSSAVLAAFLFPAFKLTCNFLSTGSFEGPIFDWRETFAPSPSLRQHEESYSQHPTMTK